MARIIFSGMKQQIAEFDASELEFTQQDGGLLLTASGSMVAQETHLVEELMQGDAACTITIVKDAKPVIDQKFNVTIFAFESDNLAILLH